MAVTPGEEWLYQQTLSTQGDLDNHRRVISSPPLTATIGATYVTPAGPVTIPRDDALLQAELDALHNDAEKHRKRGDYPRLFLPEAKAALLPAINQANDWGFNTLALKKALADAEDDKKPFVMANIAMHEAKDPFSRDTLNQFIAALKTELPTQIAQSLDDTERLYKQAIRKAEQDFVAGRINDDDVSRLKRKLKDDLAIRRDFAENRQRSFFDSECAKVERILEAAEAGKFSNGTLGGLDFSDKGLKPDLRSGESQLLWAAALTYMHSHGHLADSDQLIKRSDDLAKAYRHSFEGHKLVEQVTTQPMVQSLLNACAEAAGLFITAKEDRAKTKIFFGAPGSNYYFSPADKYINLDLPKTLAFGAAPIIDTDRQRRFRALIEPIIIHEIGHALYSERYPPQMEKLWEEIKQLAPKGGLEVVDGGIRVDHSSKVDGFTKEEYVRYNAAYAEWQALHGLWNALEDHAMNQHAVRLRVDEDRAQRYPVDTPRLLQLAYGLFGNLNKTISNYHRHSRGEAMVEPLPTEPEKLADERFRALSNASLYSYYVDSLHLLPPSEPALRAFGVSKGALDAKGFTEASIMEKITDASRRIQLDGLPSFQDENGPAWLARTGPKGPSHKEHLKAVLAAANDRRNAAIQDVFDIANAIAMPELRAAWEASAAKKYDEIKSGKGDGQSGGGPGVRIKDLPPGQSPQGTPQSGPPSSGQGTPGGTGKSIGSARDDHANNGQNQSDMPGKDENTTPQPKGPGDQGDPATPVAPQSAPGKTPNIQAGGVASRIGRTTLQKLADSKEYSGYSKEQWYKDAVKKVAKELKNTVMQHLHTVSDYASEYPGHYGPRLRDIPDPKRITAADAKRTERYEMLSEDGHVDDEKSYTYEHKRDLPSPMTHHMIMLVDGTPSMGSKLTEKDPRQKIAAKLAALMQDAVRQVNRELTDINQGVPPLTSTIIEWGDPQPNVVISSAQESVLSRRPSDRDNKLDLLTEGKGCSGTMFAPAPAAGFDHLRSKEMVAFQKGAGPKEPTVATVNTIVLSDGGIWDQDKALPVLSAMSTHPNARMDVLLLGKDSDNLSNVVRDAYDPKKTKGKHLSGTPVIKEWKADETLGFADGLLNIITDGIARAPNVAPLELDEHTHLINKAIAEMVKHTEQTFSDGYKNRLMNTESITQGRGV